MSIEKQFMKRSLELDRPADRLGPGGLMTLESKINGSRKIIYNHNISHAVNIEDPDFPLVYTGRENILASFSSMIKRSKSNKKVLKKFAKNKYNYILLTYDEKSKMYDIETRVHLEEQSEAYASKYDNKFLDSLEVGDTIKKGQLTHVSKAFDEHMNYRIGKNLNSLYMINVNTMEDGIVLMNGAEKMMNTYRLFTYQMTVGINEIPLALYDADSDNHYKAFPNVGEKIREGILMATRKIDSGRALSTVKNKHLRRIESGDKKLYCDGKIVDITVHTNVIPKELKESPTYNQVNDLVKNQLNYWDDIYRTLKKIIDNAEEEGYRYSRALTVLFDEANDKMSSTTWVGDKNDNVYQNIVIEFKVMTKDPLVPGSKMAGRCG